MNAVKFCITFLLFLSSLCRADSILVLGDSLSAAYRINPEQGWVSLLAEEFPHHEVINASVSGETTTGGLARLPRLLDEVQPDWVLIELGGNDGLRGYPAASIRDNLRAMIEAAKGAGATPIIMEIMIPPNYGPRYSQAFQQIYSLLADEYEISLISFILTDIALNAELMQEDGIHPTAEAQPLIARIVSTSLSTLMQ